MGGEDGHHVEAFSLRHALNEHLLCAGHYVRHWEYRDKRGTEPYCEELSSGVEGEQEHEPIT